MTDLPNAAAPLPPSRVPAGASADPWALPDSGAAQPAAPGLRTGAGGAGDPSGGPGSPPGGDPDGAPPRERDRDRDRAAGGPPRLPVPLRPMTMIDKLDGAFAIIKARPGKVVLIAAVVMLPVQFLSAFITRGNTSLADMLSGTSSIFSPTPASTSGLLTDTLMNMLAVGVGALGYMLLGGALTPLVTSWYTGGDISVGEALGAMVRRSHILLGAFLVAAPAHLVGALCSLPALLFTPALLVMAPAVMAEGAGPILAVQRSWRLTMRRYGSVLGVVALTVLVASTVGGLLTNLAEGASAVLPRSVRWVGRGTGAGLVSLIIAPFGVGVAILQYLDLRVRLEGLDIELAARKEFAGVARPDAPADARAAAPTDPAAVAHP